MNKLNKKIIELMQNANDLNNSKTAAVTELQDRLNVCPEQYLLHTKRFIRVINNNIETRQKLIDELKDMNILTNPERLIEITFELQEIDNKDLMASYMYTAAMDEME